MYILNFEKIYFWIMKKNVISKFEKLWFWSWFFVKNAERERARPGVRENERERERERKTERARERETERERERESERVSVLRTHPRPCVDTISSKRFHWYLMIFDFGQFRLNFAMFASMWKINWTIRQFFNVCFFCGGLPIVHEQ